MTGLLVSHRFSTRFGADFLAAVKRDGLELESTKATPTARGMDPAPSTTIGPGQAPGYKLKLLVLPPDAEARMDEAAAARADIAYYSRDIFPKFAKQFFSATRKAANLNWMQVYNAGVDHPIFASMLERGVRLTTSSGSAAEPLAQSVTAAMLMFARGFPRWLSGQHNHRWDPFSATDLPRDLRGQTMLVYGLGKIGLEIARLAHALGLKVIGVRRSSVAVEHIDEMHTPDKLAALLPKCDWLVLTCPLTNETRGMANRALLAQLPRGAHLINVSRGEVVDEPALIAALQSGQLGGAYLDVFAKEPLPADSPLWDLPNVIITPHSSAASQGNEGRVNAIFFDNVRRWCAKQPLINEVKSL